MRYAVVVMLDTERTPRNVIDEIVSNLEFDVSTHTEVQSVVVLMDDATEVAVYDRKESSDDSENHAE